MFQPSRIVLLALAVFLVSVMSVSIAEPPISAEETTPAILDSSPTPAPANLTPLPSVLPAPKLAPAPFHLKRHLPHAAPAMISGECELGEFQSIKQESSIRDALNGDLPAADSGDPILDEVLQLIEHRGSILDGSVLDPTPDKANSDSNSDQAHAAEVLLRAARLLQRVGPADKSRRELVNRMRTEAVKLLAE